MSALDMGGRICHRCNVGFAHKCSVSIEAREIKRARIFKRTNPKYCEVRHYCWEKYFKCHALSSRSPELEVLQAICLTPVRSKFTLFKVVKKKYIRFSLTILDHSNSLNNSLNTKGIRLRLQVYYNCSVTLRKAVDENPSSGFLFVDFHYKLQLFRHIKKRSWWKSF